MPVVLGTEDRTTGTWEQKTGWKGKKAVESGAWEGWDNTMETASVIWPPSLPLQSCHTSHGANYAPQPGLTKPKGGSGRLGLLQEGLFVTTPTRWAEDQWQQMRAAAPGPLQWPSWCCLPLPLKSPTQWFFGSYKPRTYADEGNSGRHSLILAKGTIQIQLNFSL